MPTDGLKGKAKEQKAKLLSTETKHKLLWSGLYSALGALATLVARRASSAIWRKATGKEPPTKK